MADALTGKTAHISSARTAPRACPVCWRRLDAVTSVSLDPSNPRPTLKIGALTQCAYCGTLLIVTTIGFRIAADVDLDALDPLLRALVLKLLTQPRAGTS
jgi:hypothetical protein